MRKKEQERQEFDRELFYDKKKFYERVTLSMNRRNLNWDSLASRISREGYSISTSNLKTYVSQRNASLKLLFYLSKTLCVSMDYLIGNDSQTAAIQEGFDYEFDSQRYEQYSGTFFVYFFPTRTNEPEELIISKLNIDAAKGFYSTLEIPVSEGVPKIYTGKLVLSKITNTAFLNMTGSNGEMIQFTFNDPNTFQNKVRLCVAALLSVSSGDAKRMPTLSRAIITEKKITDEGLDFLSANLRLNSKYINIQKGKLESVLYSFFESQNIGNVREVSNRLMSAFKVRNVYSIEEQYFLNTFRMENDLTNLQAERLIAELRNESMSSINCKIPRTIDARLYLLLKNENMFTESKQ